MFRPSDSLKEFHQALGEFVESCARLDFAVCLQLAAWKEVDPTGVGASLKNTVSFNDRVCKLRSFCDAASGRLSEDTRQSMVRWFEELNHVRKLRNEYAHGRWITPPIDGLSGLAIQFVSLEQALTQSAEIVMVELSDFEELSQVARRLVRDCDKVVSPFLNSHFLTNRSG